MIVVVVVLVQLGPVYVDESYLDKLNTMDEDEVDMIEMSMTQRSIPRLGCSRSITEEMDGMKLEVAQDI